MRKSAGIILIILGVLVISSLITLLSELVHTFSYIPDYALPISILDIVPSAFFITGGIFCFRRKYWRVCLASASFAVLIGVFIVLGLLLGRIVFRGWFHWIPFLAAVMSIIFICLKKKEWKEISDIMDCKVSYDG